MSRNGPAAVQDRSLWHVCGTYDPGAAPGLPGQRHVSERGHGSAGHSRGNGTRSDSAATGVCSAAAYSRPSRTTTAPLRSIVSTSSAARASWVREPSRRAASVSHARREQVGRDGGGRDAAADHEGEGEDAAGAVPDGAVGIVDQTLGTSGRRGQRGTGVGREVAVGGQDEVRVEVGEALQRGEGGAGGVRSVEGEVDPADVVVGERVTDGEDSFVGLPEGEVSGGVTGGGHDLPVGVAEAEQLSVLRGAGQRYTARRAGRGTRRGSSRGRDG